MASLHRGTAIYTAPMLVTWPRPITKTGEGGGRGGEDMDDLWC